MAGAGAAGDVSGYFMKSAGQDRIRLLADVVLTTAGAVDTTSTGSRYDDPSIVITKTGTTGAYSVTFPKCPRGRIIVGSVFSAASTIADGILTAVSMTAGTATLLMLAPNGTAAYGATTDTFCLEFILDTKTPS